MSGAQGADVPPAFICPITCEVMKDPVTAADGHSYEASAIMQWLASSNISPLTGQPLPNKQLARSHALRNAIQEHEQSRATRKEKERALRNVPPAPTGSKVILLGDSAVGKSSLVHRVKEGTFSSSASQPTIGCSFCTHTVELPKGRSVHLAIWDTAGQEKYRSFTRQYFRGAQAAVLLYDITSAGSFDGAKRWLSELQAETSCSVLVLVGAKLDREAERDTPKAAAIALANGANASYLECSSKDGTNVDAVFEMVAQLLLESGDDHMSGGARLHDAPMVSQMPGFGKGARPVGVAGCCQTG